MIENNILMKRICKMISINYAISENDIWQLYEKTNSIDIVIEIVRDSIIYHTSLKFELSKRNNKK